VVTRIASVTKNPELVGIQKSDFLCLSDALLKKAKLEKLLPAAFAACGLYLLDTDEAMKRISSRHMDVELESAVELTGPFLGERLKELRGVGKNQKQKKKGKKIKIASSKSYILQVRRMTRRRRPRRRKRARRRMRARMRRRAQIKKKRVR
jgi:hypothetical protein